MFEATQKLFDELEDLYIYTHKVETEAILGLTKIFKKAIESEKTIENEVRLNYVEVSQT